MHQVRKLRRNQTKVQQPKVTKMKVLRKALVRRKRRKTLILTSTMTSLSRTSSLYWVLTQDMQQTHFLSFIVLSSFSSCGSSMIRQRQLLSMTSRSKTLSIISFSLLSSSLSRLFAISSSTMLENGIFTIRFMITWITSTIGSRLDQLDGKDQKSS